MKNLLLALLALATSAIAAERPNIVWIVSEDNSHHYLRHFFAGGAPAPAIESLAAHGLSFDHAFSNAPVCSVARTTLATACYGPRIGTQFHRRYRMAPLPGDLHMFPWYLRQAGYYTTNNSKKDYNAIEGPGVWDESSGKASWRNRPDKSQPFYHMQSHAQSHESSLHFGRATYENEKTTSDPATVKLADYFPDTPLFRYTHARYLDRMGDIDEIVADTVARLKEDGLLEDTFIFYFGDHGGVLPRGKGYAYQSGLHVPLVIRVPENFKHLADAGLGERVRGFVSFIDFGPTTLQLAGVKVPDGVDGRPFLGQGITMDEVNARDESLGYADRFDEKYDLVRTLGKGRYQYVRSYQPYLPDGLQNNYRYKMLAYQEWRQLWQAGKLSGPQARFFQPKPAEALYDVEADPHQVRNLAGDPAHAGTLATMRGRLREILTGMPDLSFYPESHLVSDALSDPTAFGRRHKAEIASLLEIADLQLVPFPEAAPRLTAALDSDNWAVRYWAAMVCTAFGRQAAALAPQAEPLLEDPQEIVRVRAAEFLGRIGRINPQTVLTAVVNTTDDPVVATEALNSVVWFRDFFDGKYPVKRSDFTRDMKGGDVDDRLNYINGVPYPPKGNKAKGGNKKNKAK